MSVLYKIAYYQNRRDEVPNQELARELIAAGDDEGIREIATNLWNKDKHIQNNYIKVLYEIGDAKPELITNYTGDFFKLLKSKNNRIVWGAMTALAAVASLCAKQIADNLDLVFAAMEKGSVITVDNGIKTLALVAAQNEEYNQRIFPFLLLHLQTCRPKEVPQHAEKILAAVNFSNKDQFLNVLQQRQMDLTTTQMMRIKKVYREVAKMEQHHD